jgi:hypothetical protein
MSFTAEKYRVSISFSHKMECFWQNRRLTHLDFELKIDFFKTHKNLYIWPLCIIDPIYELHSQEIRNFSHFLPRTGIFR